jgi:hypothetical protein
VLRGQNSASTLLFLRSNPCQRLGLNLRQLCAKTRGPVFSFASYRKNVLYLSDFVRTLVRTI